MLWLSQLLSLSLIIMGALLIAGSFRYSKALCTFSDINTSRWRYLFALIAFFLAGYLAYFLFVLVESPQATQFIVAPIFFGGGLFVFTVVRISYQTMVELKKSSEADRHNALHDNLTELPNRLLLIERIDQAIALAKRNWTQTAVILMDLDRFKEVNDTFGHAAGDKLLQLLAPRLINCVRQSDTVARLGGDEFAAVLGTVNVDDAIMVSEKFQHVIDEGFFIEDHMFKIGASMGIALYPDHGTDAETLLKNADIAMYRAKRNAYSHTVYESGQDVFNPRHHTLVRGVRDAVEHKELSLVFQPKFDVARQSICSAEALLRTNGAKFGGLDGLSRETLIPLIEQLGLMDDVTNWVIVKALEQSLRWKTLGANLAVAVNVSVKNLADEQFPKAVKNLLLSVNAHPEQLIIEITESSMLANPRNAQKLLGQLADLGVLISIDDFGTGYSSISYLKHLPATEVKIDKSFITDLKNNKSDGLIVRTAIDLAHNLGFSVVAEGVENQESMDILAAWGCDQLQGHHIGKPQKPDHFFTFLSSQKIVENITH